MTRKTQKQTLFETAEAHGFTVTRDEKADSEFNKRYNQETYFAEKEGKGLKLAFDLNTAKMSWASYSTNQETHGVSGPRNFTKAKEYFKPAKTYGEVEWVEGSEPKVGVGATYCLYTDTMPYTVVEVINEKKIVVRACKATLKKDWKPEIQPGGFAGHCSNNHSQEYHYEDNLEAGGRVFTLRSNGHWHEEGQSTSSPKLRLGYRRKFYDYNF